MRTQRLRPKRSLPHFLAILAVIAFLPRTATGIGTEFLYQGHLENGATPVDGSVDFRFELFDDSLGGSSLGSLTRCAVAVDDGRFTVLLDFGAVFDGGDRWLQVGVAGSGCSSFTTLSPRQAIAPAPYAQHALDSETLGGQSPLSFLHISGGTVTGTLSVSGGLRAQQLLDSGGNAFVDMCAPGSAIRQIFADGTVTCETDDAGTSGSDNLGNHTATQNLTLNGNFLSGSGDNEGIWIDSSGNVGINKLLPASSLHVGGDVRLDAGGQIFLGDAATRIWESAGNLNIDAKATSNADVQIDAEDNVEIESNNDIWLLPDDDLIIDPGDDVRIDGRVGIGETNDPSNPSFTLHVEGTAGKTGGGTWATLSDQRLKANIRSIEGALALRRLLQLRGVRFDWIHPEAHPEGASRSGFLAQEIEAIFPEWVHEIELDGPEAELIGAGDPARAFSLPHDFFALLIEALREQDRRIRQLEAEARRERNLGAPGR